MNLIDAHTHLNDDKLYPQWKKYLSDFQAIGGHSLVVIGTNTQYNARAIKIANQASGVQVKCSIGYDPSEIAFGDIDSSDKISDAIDNLKKLYKDHSEHIVAIGEGGLDAYYPNYDNDHPLQFELLESQCLLARELNLPIVVHSRECFDDTINILSRYPNLKIYLHCRSYGPDEIQIITDKLPNLWIGRCGNTSYPRAENLRQSLKTFYQLSSEPRILLETDAPYLPVQKYRGETNHPALISHLYDYISTELNINRELLQQQVLEAYNNLYLD